MAFPLRHPVVAGIVVGMRSADEVRRNVAAFGAAIPDQVWADLRAEGLLDETEAARTETPRSAQAGNSSSRAPCWRRV
ncbi:hypothetical protein OG453_39885 [Streptomyces sp. NBC_01381]|uniref:hypothetical protein n=1 Tax=Streptomyces sp. NBC_01381 TaxID=2903845 RepID=UPI002259838D|nr:hypothetical protein [Streptomyces sp. NBC_01381]MCX4672734.1 hypothetical protein [Streptomyces sp. NBC_01381]